MWTPRWNWDSFFDQLLFDIDEVAPARTGVRGLQLLDTIELLLSNVAPTFHGAAVAKLKEDRVALRIVDRLRASASLMQRRRDWIGRRRPCGAVAVNITTNLSEMGS